MKLVSILVSVITVAVFFSLPKETFARNDTFSSVKASGQAISISVTPTRVSVGDTVRITIEAKNDGSLRVEVLVPDKGVLPLKLNSVKPSVYASQFIVTGKDPQGLYAIQAWTGQEARPAAIGKATFLFKKLIGDFCITGIFNPKNPEKDMDKYIQEMKGFGANFLIATSIITPKIVYYKSSICDTNGSSVVDQSYVDDLLKCADKNGISVMLSATWDATRDIPYPDRTKSTEDIIKELYGLYGSHPSLVGFYVDQEGSGIYYAPFVRKLCGYVKQINPGLLTACSPYVDNPLLASYLSVIRNLDVIIYQGMVMASYRPDNRIKFPLRRVKDFGSLSSGAKELQNKIALTHVETFGYGENRLEDLFITGYNNIYQQILSAATVPDNDGIIMYDYSGSNYNMLNQYPQYRKEFIRSRDAVFDGMKAFELIGKASKDRNQLAVYFPYTDWQEYRWARYYYSALDAFRMMGIPVDVLPYAPPHRESYPPYWPFHENRHVLKRLLKEKEVLVLPSVSGFQATDSDLIKHFVGDGGTIIAFGPRIPMGRTYDRTLLFGIEKTGRRAAHSEIIGQSGLDGKTPHKGKWKLGKVTLPVWRSEGAKIIAEFEDGSPAIAVNTYGKGTVVSILTDAKTAARYFPDLVREVLNRVGVQRYVDVIGTNQNCDVAVSKTRTGFIAAVVNHNNTKLHITLRPLTAFSHRESQDWIDMVSDKEIAKLKSNEPLGIVVKPRTYRLIEMAGSANK